MSKLRMEIMTITPDVAREWLELNRQNRKMRKDTTVKRYANDMQAGRWEVTGEAIKFSDRGLEDGQHRLQACVIADVEFTSLVIWGVNPSAQDVMDTGMIRHMSDQLTLSGHASTATLASAARLVKIWEKNLINNNQSRWAVISHSEMMTFIEKNPKLIDAVRVGRKLSEISLSASRRSALYFILADIHEDRAYEFFTKLNSLESLPPGSPILVLSRRLVSIKTKNLQFGITDAFSLTIRAWNAWHNNRSVGALHLNVSCPLPIGQKFPIKYGE